MQMHAPSVTFKTYKTYYDKWTKHNPILLFLRYDFKLNVWSRPATVSNR